MPARRRRRRAMSAMMHPGAIVRMVVVVVTASRQHQQQCSANNGNDQLSHGSPSPFLSAYYSTFSRDRGNLFHQKAKTRKPLTSGVSLVLIGGGKRS